MVEDNTEELSMVNNSKVNFIF